MKRLSFSDLTLYVLFLYLSNELICPPDSFKSNDNYWDKKDYLDSENYDKWFGIYYERKSFSTQAPISTLSLVDDEITNNIHLYDSSQPNIFIEINSNLIQKREKGEYDLYFRIVNNGNDNINFAVKLFSEKISNTITIEQKKSKFIKVPLIFYSNSVYSSLTGQTSPISFDENLKIKFTDENLLLSTFQMMSRRGKEELTYAGGNECDENENRRCIEGYGCKNNNCAKCSNPGCNKCHSDLSVCDECFSISSEINGNCNLEFIDLTKFSITYNESILKVPPAIHWKVNGFLDLDKLPFKYTKTFRCYLH